MPVISLPEETKPFRSLKVAMDGVNYIVRLEWNMRSGWYLGLSDAAGEIIFSPRKLVEGWDLLQSSVDARRPPGKLALVDTSGKHREAGYEDLGDSHLLTYLSPDELEELGL